MNVYFVVEGKKTEAQIYPEMLSYLLPSLVRIENFREAKDNNYYLFNSGGYPCILDDMNHAIEEINEIGQYDMLVICLDSDGRSIQEVKKDVLESINTELKKCRIEIVVQSICFETWFLGNRKVVKRNPSDTFKEYLDFYDVRTNNPEIMGKFERFKESESQFHSVYLKKMLAERNITYSKAKPTAVASSTYIAELISRVKDTNDLESFKNFIELCEDIKKQLK